eukprot:scaffold3300_cov69-Phaeocystis_antarctica.AAC.1
MDFFSEAGMEWGMECGGMDLSRGVGMGVGHGAWRQGVLYTEWDLERGGMEWSRLTNPSKDLATKKKPWILREIQGFSEGNPCRVCMDAFF